MAEKSTPKFQVHINNVWTDVEGIETGAGLEYTEPGTKRTLRASVGAYRPIPKPSKSDE